MQVKQNRILLLVQQEERVDLYAHDHIYILISAVYSRNLEECAVQTVLPAYY